VTIRAANANYRIPQYKNCWRWDHLTFSCRIQGSKYIKCNEPHKSENHCKFGWCCKANEKLIHYALKPKKVNHAHTCSSIPIVKANIRQTPQYVHSGRTTSIESGTRRSTLRSMETESNQFIQLGMGIFNNDL